MVKAFVVTSYLYALPAIQSAIEENQGQLVGAQSELNSMSLNRNIRRHQAEILILTLDHENKKPHYQLIEEVRQEHPSIKIITIAKNATDIPLLIKRKVKGILLVNEGIDQLINAIKIVIAGLNYYSPRVNQIIADALPNDLNCLTDKEYQVFYLLKRIEDKDLILSTLDITGSTLRTHVQNIKFKLNIQKITT